MVKNVYEHSIYALNVAEEALDGYGAFNENDKLLDIISGAKNLNQKAIENQQKEAQDLENYKIDLAQKWFDEEMGYMTRIAYDKSTIEIFVSNGKGGDGHWVGISKNEIEMAVDDYQQLISEQAAEEYMDFMKANDLNPSKETELEYAKYLLKENRRNDALDYVDDEEELQTLEAEISNSKIKSRKM